MIKLATFAAEVNADLRGKDPHLRTVARALRAFVKKTLPRVKETMNAWRIPTFESDGPMCYLNVAKHHITFGFMWGTSLDDPEGLLEGSGKNLRHVKVRAVDELRQKGLRQLVLSAARRNRAARAARLT